MAIPNHVVVSWVEGLPLSVNVIVSLLGQKPDGSSEFKFYSHSVAAGSNGVLASFEDWIRALVPNRPLKVVEHPTIDMQPLSTDTLIKIGATVGGCLADGDGLVIVDSGGVTRTGAVCAYLRAQRHPNAT